MKNFQLKNEGSQRRLRPGYLYRSADEGEILKVEVYHDPGGTNWFSGNVEKRGVKVSVSPVKREKCGSGYSEKHTLCDGAAKSGLRFLVMETRALNRKLLAEVAEALDATVPRLADHWRTDTNAAIALMKQAIAEFQLKKGIAA